MGFNHYRFARRVDGDNIKVVLDGNDMLKIGKTATARRIYGGGGTGKHLVIYANTTDAQPYMIFSALGSVTVIHHSSGSLFLGDEGGNYMSFRGGTDASITTDSNKNLYLNTGTGKVKFGTHSAITTETLSGYIPIKDSGGTDRKLAVIS